MTKHREQKIEDLILKVAKGFQIAEVTEEFVEVDGELKLTKRKKTKKDVPPDWKALQLLLGNSPCAADLSTMSDEELECERQRLLEELQDKCIGKAVVEEAKNAPKRPKPRKKKPTPFNQGK